MGELVNLNHKRKERRKEEEKQKAEENRIRFGRTGAERKKDAKAARRDSEALDGKKLDQP